MSVSKAGPRACQKLRNFVCDYFSLTTEGIALNFFDVINIVKSDYSVIMQGGGGTFSPMCTSDSIDSCMAPGFWQTLISIAEVGKRYFSEIESYKSKRTKIDKNGTFISCRTICCGVRFIGQTVKVLVNHVKMQTVRAQSRQSNQDYLVWILTDSKSESITERLKKR